MEIFRGSAVLRPPAPIPFIGYHQAVSLLGRLSILGAAPPPPGAPLDDVLHLSREERTLAVVCRNLGLPSGLESAVLARQLLARHQAEEIGREVEVLPLKGLHLAHRVYPSPELRDMGDLDLLVRPLRRREADAALRKLGYAPEFDPERLSGGSLAAVEYQRDGSLPVHLHWDVSNASLPRFMYRIDLDEIWSEARDGALAPAHLVVTLCEHALKHSYAHLIHLTDIELASRGVDWKEVAAASRRWGLERAVYYALALLRDLAEVESPGLRHLNRPSLDWAGKSFLAMTRRRRWEGLSALGLMSMTRQKARFVREVISPPRREGLRTRTVIGRLWGAATRVGAGLTSWPERRPRH